MHLHYNRQGQPISMEQWMAAMAGDRHVGLTDLGARGKVSTIWLGLNYCWGDGPPLIFETMIFGGPMDQYQERYATEEEALIGHEFVVMMAVNILSEPEKRPALIHNGKKPRR